MSGQRIRVVGAGVAGLTCARLLRAAGLAVDLVDAGERPGGKLNVRDVDGRRFDTGPSLLTWPQVLREVFAACGEAFPLTLQRLDPLFRYIFPDGSVVERSDEWDHFVRGLLPLWEAVEVPFLRRPLSLRANVSRLPALARLRPFRTLHALAAASFEDARLVRILDRYATYAGSDPYRAPATLAVIPALEALHGGWHVMGGLYGIAAALADGLDVRCGVRATPGPAPEVWAAGARPRRPSLSGVVLLLGVRSRPERVLHHTVVFSADYRAEFADLAAGRFPRDPTVYLCAPGGTDPALDGQLFVMANAPASGCDLADARARMLARLAVAGIEPEVDAEVVRGPDDYGPIYGEASNSPWAAFRRPPVRTGTPGHYRAGAGAHPGGGLPLAMLSGTMAADAVLHDLRKQPLRSEALYGHGRS